MGLALNVLKCNIKINKQRTQTSEEEGRRRRSWRRWRRRRVSSINRR